MTCLGNLGSSPAVAWHFAKCCLQVQNAFNFTLFLRSYILSVVRSYYTPVGQFFPPVAPLEGQIWELGHIEIPSSKEDSAPIDQH